MIIKFYQWLKYLILRAFYRALFRKICLIKLKKTGSIYGSECFFNEITGRDWATYSMPVSFKEFPEGLGKGYEEEFERQFGI